MPTTIVNLPSPFAAGSTPIYTSRIVDQFGNPIPAVNLATLTLSIVDTLNRTIINGVSQVNILNTGRGTVDSNGNVVVTLEPGDTSMDEVPGSAQVQRSLVFDWTYGSQPLTGRHQANFILNALAGP